MVCHNLIFIFNCGPFIRVLLLFQRKFSVRPVFMTQSVFQSLLVDHIWMLLLFQVMFWEGQVLMLLYLLVEHLYDASLVLEDFSSCSRIPPIIKRLNSLIVVFFRMVHNEKIFRRSKVNYRTFSEGPTWSDLFLCCYKKWKVTANCSNTTAYSRKIVKFLVSINSEHPYKAISLVFEAGTVGPCLVQKLKWGAMALCQSITQ